MDKLTRDLKDRVDNAVERLVEYRATHGTEHYFPQLEGALAELNEAWQLFHRRVVEHMVSPADLSELRGTVEGYEQLFEMQWRRSREADKLWQAEKPEERANVWPDLGELLKWLMDRSAAVGKVRDLADEITRKAGAHPENGYQQAKAIAMRQVTAILDGQAAKAKAEPL